MTLAHGLAAVARHYWDLGVTSFGGPGVHVVILRKRFVHTLKWLDETTFLDLFSLGNALPGPGSTQLAFSIAVVCQGLLPGLLAFLLWSLPGAVGMAALAAGIARIPDTLPPLVLALLSGLNAAAVGLIALAAVQLARNAATDKFTTVLLWLSASAGVCYHAPWMYPVLIAGGGVATLLWDFRRQLFIAPARRLLKRSPESTRGDSANGSAIELNDVAQTQSQGASASRPSSTGTTQNGHGAGVADGASNGHAGNASTNGQTDDDKRDVPADTTPVLRRNTPSVASSARVTEVEAEYAQPPSRLKVVSPRMSIALLVGFVLFLAVPLGTRAGLQNAGRAVPRSLDFFCNMVVAGTIIFGGGPVVIPLLRDYVVVEGWVSSRDFLLVFAVLQAFPGPNFNFAVALGVLALSGSAAQRVLGAFAGYVGIFAPGILLKLALLPLYASWRDRAPARAVIRGLNATASGLVFTAVWQLFLVGYIYTPAAGADPNSPQTLSGPLTADPFWAAVCSGAYVASNTLGSPPWLSIAGGGLAGMAWYGVRQS